MPTLTPYLIVTPAADAIEFYKRAFGFEELRRMPMPDGKIMHAALRLGDSMLMLADEFPGMGPSGCGSPRSLNGTTSIVHIDSPDVDAAFKRAVDAGAKALLPPQDMFWGDRYGQLADPFGHHWSIATHKEAVSPEEMKRRMAEMFKNPCPPGQR